MEAKHRIPHIAQCAMRLEHGFCMHGRVPNSFSTTVRFAAGDGRWTFRISPWTRARGRLLWPYIDDHASVAEHLEVRILYFNGSRILIGFEVAGQIDDVWIFEQHPFWRACPCYWTSFWRWIFGIATIFAASQDQFAFGVTHPHDAKC